MTLPAIATSAEAYEAFLLELGACKEACDWSRGKTANEAWAECEEGSWLMWLLIWRLPNGPSEELVAGARAAGWHLWSGPAETGGELVRRQRDIANAIRTHIPVLFTEQPAAAEVAS